MSWASVNLDPTAGVTLVPRVIRCGRCGVVKGRADGSARPGLCVDCRAVLPPAERVPWRVAA